MSETAPLDEAPLSPCVRQCGLDDTRSYCISCRRTRDEIIAWRGLTNPQRLAIMDALPARHIEQA